MLNLFLSMSLLCSFLYAKEQTLQEKLQQSLTAKGSSYQPRTQYLDLQNKPQFTNRLILEDSPYLLQHAHNPVNWYAWGEDAFKAAKKQNKPIFLSIGYSTCHWCHVMEEESFDNIDIATILNKYFICIKVDREQYPDVDSIYMQALLVLKGSGGWPLNLFLTPDAKPIFGDTYFTTQKFRELLIQINNLWQTQQRVLLDNAERLHLMMEKMNTLENNNKIIGDTAITAAIKDIEFSYDSIGGGFGSAPKFPNEPYLLFLLEYQSHYYNKERQSMIDNTLTSMAFGGIYDYIGGGFHRYTTDRFWNIPHFEKMLYNQAQLSLVYAKAYQLTANKLYHKTAIETLDYTLNEMRTSQGAFYSATDADSEGEEGLFFLWSQLDFNKYLTKEDALIASKFFNIQKFSEKNILHKTDSISEFAIKNSLSINLLTQTIDRVRKLLYAARKQRIAPHTDSKIITTWNAMMIESLAFNSLYLREPHYLEAALKCADYLWKYHHKKDDSLWRISLNQKASIDAVLQDYASLAKSFVSLYDITKKKLWLQRAENITNKMITLFWDKKSGGFFLSNKKTSLGIDFKPSIDNAISSANSIAYQLLILLSQRTQNYEYIKYAEQTLAIFSKAIERQASSYSSMLKGMLMKDSRSSIQYTANGIVRAEAQWNNKDIITLALDILPGWHINSAKANDKNLISTTVTLVNSNWNLVGVQFPKVKKYKLGFSNEMLELYKNKVLVKLFVKGRKDYSPLNFKVELQACSDKNCLAPESFIIMMPKFVDEDN